MPAVPVKSQTTAAPFGSTVKNGAFVWMGVAKLGFLMFALGMVICDASIVTGIEVAVAIAF